MLQVIFFARVREELGCGGLQLEWSDTLSTLDALQEHLCTRDNGRWREVLTEPNIVRAVNQTVVVGDAPLSANDEVAFFPPVTGG